MAIAFKVLNGQADLFFCVFDLLRRTAKFNLRTSAKDFKAGEFFLKDI
jgi:hypothetical protein